MIERDSLRDKLRAAEKAMDVVEGKVERLEEEHSTLGDDIARTLYNFSTETCAANKDTFCLACGSEWHESVAIPGTQYHTCSR